MDRKYANFLLRVLLGAVFTFSGVMKILGFFKIITYTFPPIDKILTFLPVNITGILLGALELVVGILLIIGLWTRVAAWVATGLLVIFVLVGAYLGIFMQLALFKDVVMAAAALLLAAEGCRKWGLDVKGLKGL